MENLQQKADFLRNDYARLLSQLDVNTPRQWGKMNVQQMIEHMSDYIRIASGRTPMEVHTPEDQVPRMQAFLASEKPFRENTPNVLMPDEPAPPRLATKEAAIEELKEEIAHFFAVHQLDTNKTTANPFFGHLGYEQQVRLLHKHALHHLKQFGVAVPQS